MNRSHSRRSPRSQDSRSIGFTLIEVLLVLVILVILGSIAVPMYLNILKKAHIQAATAQVQLLEGAIDLYVTTANRSPAGLSELIDPPSDPKLAINWAGPYLKQNRTLIDPWQDPYQYTAKGMKNR